MDLLKKLVTRKSSNQLSSKQPLTHCKIVISQYERNDYSVENPEQLHWAIVVIQDVDNQRGPCWQAIDRHYRDGRVEWAMASQPVILGKTTKCLGGVCIGYIGVNELDNLEQVILSHPPTPRFHGWNCRDWIMELVALLRERGWIKQDIPAQTALYPAMRKAGGNTQKRRSNLKDDHVDIVDFNNFEAE